MYGISDDLYHSAAALPTVQERINEINRIARQNNIDKDYDESDVQSIDQLNRSSVIDDTDAINIIESRATNRSNIAVRKGVGLLLTSVGVQFQYPGEFRWGDDNCLIGPADESVEYLTYNKSTNLLSIKLKEPYKFTKVFSKASRGADWIKSKI